MQNIAWLRAYCLLVSQLCPCLEGCHRLPVPPDLSLLSVLEFSVLDIASGDYSPVAV